MSTEISNVFRLRMDVAQKCIEDPDFLEAFKSDPNGTLSKFVGSDCSKLKINIVEEDADTLTFPIAKLESELSIDQLEAVAGGAFFAATVAAVSGIAASQVVTQRATGGGW